MSKAVAKQIDAVPAPVSPTDETSALISMIERAARDPAVDIEKMERLYAMKERADATRAKAAYLTALSCLQKVLPAAPRKGTAHNNKSYARFEDLIETIRPHMAAHTMSLSYRIDQAEGQITVSGVLGHGGGHSETTSITLPADTTGNKNAVQALGSSVSYGKRYVTLTLLGMATEDDDDGKAAGGGLITPEQAAELEKLIKETKSDVAKFLEMGGIDSLTDMPAKQFQAAKALLLKKRGML